MKLFFTDSYEILIRKEMISQSYNLPKIDRKREKPVEQSAFSSYTEGAHRAIALAQKEALRQGRRCVMPIDLLVGLLQDTEKSSAARRALSILGIEASAVCRTLDRIEAPAAGRAVDRREAVVPSLPDSTETTFGYDSNRIFARATGLAEEDGESHIGTEHLLMALYDDRNAPLVRAILQDFGVKSNEEQSAREMVQIALEQAVRSRPLSASS